MKVILATAFLLAACADEDNSTNGKQNTTACTTTADCGDGYVCLAVGNERGCTPVCSGSTDECGGSAQCGGVGVLDVEVCQEPPANNETPEPEEQPRVACSKDSDCQALQSNAICAEFQGSKDCTLPCDAEPDCDMPVVGGLSIDFMTCLADEGQPARKACLPDADCFANPLSCIDMGGLPEFTP